MGKRKGHCAGGCWSGDPQKPLGCWRSLSEEIRLVSLRGPRSPWGVGSGLQQRVIEQSLPLSSEDKHRPTHRAVPGQAGRADCRRPSGLLPDKPCETFRCSEGLGVKPLESNPVSSSAVPGLCLFNATTCLPVLLSDLGASPGPGPQPYG